jgi:hypothetical protein
MPLSSNRARIQIGTPTRLAIAPSCRVCWRVSSSPRTCELPHLESRSPGELSVSRTTLSRGSGAPRAGEKLQAGWGRRVRSAEWWKWLDVEELWLIAQENPWHVVMRNGGRQLPFCLLWADSMLRAAPTLQLKSDKGGMLEMKMGSSSEGGQATAGARRRWALGTKQQETRRGTVPVWKEGGELVEKLRKWCDRAA